MHCSHQESQMTSYMWNNYYQAILEKTRDWLNRCPDKGDFDDHESEKSKNISKPET